MSKPPYVTEDGKLNLQHCFNVAWNGAQKFNFERSMSNKKGPELAHCVYRADNGNSCAIGHILVDLGVYDPKFEGLACWPGSQVGKAIREKLGIDEDWQGMESLRIMQSCHDGALSPKDYEYRMRLFAKGHELSIPESPAESGEA